MNDPAERFSDSGHFEPAPIVCPHCGAGIDPQSVSGPIITCPQCNEEFFAPAQEPIEEPSEEEQEKRQADEVRDNELSELRIKQLSTLLRANYRTRSYLIVGTIGCLWAIIPLLIFAVEDTRASHRLTLWTVGVALFALLAAHGAVKFGKGWKRIQEEINTSRADRAAQEAEAAKAEPDWSTLSDGSQQAKKLEGMFSKASEKMVHDGHEEHEGGNSNGAV